MLINLSRMVGRDSNMLKTLNGGLRDVLTVSGCKADDSWIVLG